MHPFHRLKLTTTISLLLALIIGLALFGTNRLATHAVSTSLKPSLKLKNASGTSPASCGAWNIISSPSVGSHSSLLYGVAALSKNNVWAVGFSVVNPYSDATLIEHWNGTNWTIVRSPNIGQVSVLYGITALSTHDIWAIGDYSLSNGTNPQALIEHWDGTNWTIVSSPPYTSANVLYGITALSPNDIWAVGFSLVNNNFNLTLIEHWNGTSWIIVPSPNVSPYSYLYSVTALSKNDVWTVGYSFANNVDNRSQALIEHWNGISWNVVPSPNVEGVYSNALSGIASVPGSSIIKQFGMNSSKELWAVGNTQTGDATEVTAEATLVEHWNGVNWNALSQPIAGQFYFLNAVAAVSANNVWAVGSYSSTDAGQTLIEHWDGKNWNVVPSPNIGLNGNGLYGVAQVPGSSQIWAVGQYYDDSISQQQTLIEFYC